jgi:hypothetical protein
MPELVLGAINFVVSLTGAAVLFALIFRYVPETKIAWKDVDRSDRYGLAVHDPRFTSLCTSEVRNASPFVTDAK